MFTGIVEEMGEVLEIRRGSVSFQLTISVERVCRGMSVGESVAVNGVCLTVVRYGPGEFTVEVSPETRRVTNLGELKRGEKVNLERAMMLSDRIGGHLVSGHCEGTGTIARRDQEGDSLLLFITTSREILRYCIKKGSIAVDGVSLTIADLTEAGFTVVIIPHTAGMTTLGIKKIGDTVNIETDMIGRYVERFIVPLRPGGS